MRRGIETSFRNLKHTLGLLHLHAKKVEFVLLTKTVSCHGALWPIGYRRSFYPDEHPGTLTALLLLI